MLNPQPELYPTFYRDHHPDLAGMSDEQLHDHWTRYGIAEGRRGSPSAMKPGLLSLIEQSDSILEIGPFTNPAITDLPKIKYFDVMDRAGLIDRAKAIGYPYERAVAIDYVSPTADLSAITETFDVVFSSHCIEHQPDLINHLAHISRILKQGGAYLLVIPDRRYCFDHFIADTTLEKVVAARGRKVHTLESVIEHRAHTTHNDVARHWAGDHGRPAYEGNPALIEWATAEFNSAKGDYLDVHAWQFTPASFSLLIRQLNEAKLTSLLPVAVYPTPHGYQEFCAVLKKPGGSVLEQFRSRIRALLFQQ
jgi:SAM-dependent methyltransferase